MGCMSSSAVFAANNAFGIDEINWTDKDWDSIVMADDDTVQTGVIIRSSADENSEAVGYLYRGAAACIISKGEEWSEIRSGKVCGFAKNEFLASGDEARGLAAHYGKQGVVANWNDVHVFSKNDAQSDVSGTLENGTLLGVVEDNGHWITVQLSGQKAGYASEEDVTRMLLVDSAVPAEGEDEADVATGMTAADVPAPQNQGNAEENTPAAEMEYEEPAAQTQRTESGEESQEENSSYEEMQVSAQDYSSYEDPSGSQSGYDGQTETYSSKQVSDDAQIQSLYDTYIQAQNAAMSCTSNEDAVQKAEAATAAWNAYTAACGASDTASASDSSSADGTSYSSGQTSEDTCSSGQTSEDTCSSGQTSEDTCSSGQTSEDTYSTGESSTGSESQAETSAQESQSSSGSSAYGSWSDLDLLAAIIWCEAGNQPYDGMVAVGQVVMNRVKSSAWPNTISEVLNQAGQFTPASSGALQSALSQGVNSTCYAAATDAMNGATPVSGTPVYFNTHSGSYKLGAHYFS